MTTQLDVNWCCPLAIHTVGDEELLTHDIVKNGRRTWTGGIAVEIKFSENPTEGRILLFNICTSHSISIEKEKKMYRFDSDEFLNDYFDDGKNFYQDCSINSQSIVFQDFVYFKLEETWTSIEFALTFTSFIVHEQNNALIPVSSFDWFLKANCARDENNMWQLIYSCCSSLSDILGSQKAYTADEVIIDFKRLEKLIDRVERWRQEEGI